MVPKRRRHPVTGKPINRGRKSVRSDKTNSYKRILRRGKEADGGITDYL